MRSELDEDARIFALGLIDAWISDPSNVRLLRIGLDLWPDYKLLKYVLALLSPFTEENGRRKKERRVAWYCLSEVLHAGATETGLVPETESLPSKVDLNRYRNELCTEAKRLVALPTGQIPWYLRQKALLFLATSISNTARYKLTRKFKETQRYRILLRFLRGDDESSRLQDQDFATVAVLARRAFMDRAGAIELVRRGLNRSRLVLIADRDPLFALELVNTQKILGLRHQLPIRIRDDLCLDAKPLADEITTLATAVLKDHPNGALRNELSLLHFAKAFLIRWRLLNPAPDVITPMQVQFRLDKSAGIAKVKDLCILTSDADTSESMYVPPLWCSAKEQWRIQLGYLLRFILSRQPDFTRCGHRASWKEGKPVYRPAVSHWFQRRYGLFSGQSAFGDKWLPISDWVENFLLALLHWPGCRVPKEFDCVNMEVESNVEKISDRIDFLEKHQYKSSSTLFLPFHTRRPTSNSEERPLRACVVQTVYPAPPDFESAANLTLDDPESRRKHRIHLSAALEAVKRILILRDTHSSMNDGLDWLILPELSVHPDDIRNHLIPFARAHKVIVLAGLTYQQLFEKEQLVNSAVWVIPEWSDECGLQIKTRLQGKRHLAPIERKTDRIQGFRPCQWLIGYPWSGSQKGKPISLTAVVCYDATELGFMSNFRDVSDVVAIPALNQDVTTFDKLASVFNYHLFQVVIVANNGLYGGSNAYWPQRTARSRQIFHMHGQRQASIAYIEIDKIEDYSKRHDADGADPSWKHPPAGYTKKPL